MMLLYTFKISHYAERARWALDRNGCDYAERHLVPGTHLLTIRRIAPTTTVPVLVHGGTVVQGSGAILDYLERRVGARALAPRPEAAKECAEIEALAEDAFGLAAVRVFYGTLLHHPREVIRMWTQDGPSWSRAFHAVSFPFMAYGTRRNYGIRRETVEEAKDAIRRAMDRTDRLLEGRAYLAGDAFSRADVTVAALLALLCRPPEHVFRSRGPFPGDLGAFVAELEGRPTWTHALRMYREER